MATPKTKLVLSKSLPRPSRPASALSALYSPDGLTSCFSTIRSLGFTFRPSFVKTVYFCEHEDDGDVDKVTTYITWVNNQLSRDPASQPITSLERGLADGVTLPKLLSILGDEPVPGVLIPPKSEQSRKQNIRLCFQYLQQRHIHPRNSTAPDVSNGNLKCIMRLLLALAANFKTYKPPETRSVFGYASTEKPAVVNHTETESTHVSIDDVDWMYNNVIDTKKQLESLRLLLLRDASIIDEGGKGGGGGGGVGKDCKSLIKDNSTERCWRCSDKDATIEELRKRLRDVSANKDKQLSELKLKLSAKNDELLAIKAIDKRHANSKRRQELHNTNPSPRNFTKILYYIGNSTTPYLSDINKPIGQITLSDFKALVNRSGCYRYCFKSYDTDVGAVREEVKSDSAVLPAWDGRVIGFLEKLDISLDQIEI